jgi:hypothetical protein
MEQMERRALNDDYLAQGDAVVGEVSGPRRKCRLHEACEPQTTIIGGNKCRCSPPLPSNLSLLSPFFCFLASSPWRKLPNLLAMTELVSVVRHRSTNSSTPTCGMSLCCGTKSGDCQFIRRPFQDDRQQYFPQDAAKFIARGDDYAEVPFPVGKVTDGMTIPGRDGNQIPIRIYTPSGTGPFPVITYYHGGGFVLGSIDIYDESPRELSTYAGAIVVSVSYRLAPEHPFPAGYNDSVDAYKWVLASIASYGGNSSQVAIAGESAGGSAPRSR